MKHTFFSKFLVFIAVLCFAFKAFSVGTFVTPTDAINPIPKILIKINHSNNYSLFQYQNHESNLFEIDNEEIEEDLDADDDQINLDFICTKKPYFYLNKFQKSETCVSNIRKKSFAESTPIFIQFRNFRL